MSNLALIPLLAVLLIATRGARMQQLGPVRRLQLLAGLSLVSLLLLRLAIPFFQGGIVAAATQRIHIDVALFLAAVAVAWACGLAWRAILDDAGYDEATDALMVHLKDLPNLNIIKLGIKGKLLLHVYVKADLLAYNYLNINLINHLISRQIIFIFT